MPFMKHLVIAEDTLPALAQRYLGDADRWMEIALLNNLEYPYIVNQYRDTNTPPNVKAIGETLLIPIEEPIENEPYYELKQEYNHVLGTDIDVFSSLYSQNGETLVNLTKDEQAELTTDTYGDIQTVNGLKNLHQAILLRLMTPQGSLLHHPDYGSQIHEILGSPDTETQLQKLKIEIERTIRSDGRVEDVTVSVTSEGQVVYADISIKPIGINRILELGLRLDSTGVVSWA